MTTAAQKVAKISELLAYLSPEERAEVVAIQEGLPIWTPLAGPQLEAYESPADILFFGGSAGGSKTDLLIGLALTRHQRSIIYRRESVQHQAIIDRLAEILGTRVGFNSTTGIWRLPHRQIELGACKDPGDEIKYQGRPHDLKGFDEITHFLESQFRFLMGWLRSTKKGQRWRIVCTGNPPTTMEGRWVISFWAPWLDDHHPNPAKPGEIRWYTTIDGKDVERPDGTPFMHKGRLVKPLSRTFIPSKVTDNPFLMATGYDAILEALPEPLRSQMLEGDFRAGIEDSQWQVCPTPWVDLAMARWSEDGKKGPMDSAGVDVARGGNDKFIISTRHEWWFNKLVVFPGSMTPDGATGAGLIISVVRDGAPIHVDVIGVGGSVVDHLKSNNIQVVPVNGAEAATDGVTDKATGRLKFRNMRSLIWWRFRELLDPKIGANIALPPDPELKADLCAPLWTLTPTGILIESKEDHITATGVVIPGLKRRLGRSPDKGDAVVYCSIMTAKTHSGADWRKKMPKGTWRSA